MTILYLDFELAITADNVKRDANKKLTVEAGRKIRLRRIGIAPATVEDTFILLSKGKEQLFGDGIHHSIIDDFTHVIEVNAIAEGGEEFIVSARAPTAKTLHGYYEYEYIT